MTDKTIKEQLRQLMDETCQECDFILASMDETDRHASGTITDWAIKDLISHIAFWTQHHAKMIAAVRKGEAPEIFPDFLKVNDQVFEEHKNQSLAEAQDYLEQAYQGIGAELDQLSEDDLRNTEEYTWTNKRPLYASIFGEAFSHPLTHLGQHQIKRGNIPEAHRLNERVAAAMVELDDTPYARGVAAYNLACFYALIGEADKAIELLDKALQLAPSLKDWSKEDPDLISLHDKADYQALYG